MKLIISNKATSPWPFRAWLLLKMFDIPFEEQLIDLSQPNKRERLKAVSPSGRVPVLVDGDVTVWESLAIVEYIAELFPDKNIWPKEPSARAHARSIANEMHSGFAALRRNCVFNMLKAPAQTEFTDEVLADIVRVVEIWTGTRSRFGAGGPFLYGTFSAADAMYAPTVSRFRTFSIDVSDAAQAYMSSLEALPSWAEWLRAASDN